MARTLMGGELLKKEWMEMSASCFEPLTFGELKVGQKFISLPSPGDNSGHGGFRRASYLFTKTKESIRGFGIPTGEARRDFDGNKSSCPHEMFVKLVE